VSRPDLAASQQVLVLNTGSSSIKYQLLEMSSARVLVTGLLQGVGEDTSTLSHRPAGGAEVTINEPVADHEAGFTQIQAAFEQSGGMPTKLAGIGHRVVHGGARFTGPARIDDDVIAAIEALIPLAPLHNPSNLTGIRLARALYPDVAQVAVFDTAFHSTMPATAYRYALPRELADRLGIRRYGFHGTSHEYVSRSAAEHLEREPAELKLISLHLGNGASVAAIDGGRSVDTSMGMTPLEGLVMGTRSGDLDPAAVLYLQSEGGLSASEVDSLLNKQSGLKGLAGSNDTRTLSDHADAGDESAVMALEIFCYRIRKYIGAYAVVLGRLDGLIFTAGIGENSARIRAQVCAGLGLLGIRLDPELNAERSPRPRTISAAESAVPVLVVPTNEELQIARLTLATIGSRPG
jgi:acetate kinase